MLACIRCICVVFVNAFVCKGVGRWGVCICACASCMYVCVRVCAGCVDVCVRVYACITLSNETVTGNTLWNLDDVIPFTLPRMSYVTTPLPPPAHVVVLLSVNVIFCTVCIITSAAYKSQVLIVTLSPITLIIQTSLAHVLLTL